MVRRRIRLAQNFFRDPRLVASIVAQARFDRRDVVYEIGPGEGIITRALARVCGRVVAVEIDRELFARLRARFRDVRNVELHNEDFLGYRIRDRPYKIFSAIPYNRTAGIMRKLLRAEASPTEAYLVMQKDAAEKFAGTPRERQASLLIKPWFSLAIVRRFQRTDFEPVPGVDSVLLRIRRRDRPLVSSGDPRLYRAFVRYGFSRWRANLRQNFKEVFTATQWKRLARNLGFHIRAQPSDLRFEQWLGIFEFFLGGIARSQITVPAGLLCRPGRSGPRRRRRRPLQGSPGP